MSPLVALDHLLRTSATLNGVSIPGRHLDRTLARHTFNVWINNPDDSVYRTFLRGSGTAIRFRGLELLLCTQHQLDGVDHQQVAMLADDGEKLITSGGVRFYTRDEASDALDIVAFNFSQPVAAFPQFRGRFFELRSVPPSVDFDDVTGFILTGFAYADQRYLLSEDSNAIDLGRRSVVCRLAPDVPADRALLRVVPESKLDFDPDGMSGGSAFVVQLVAGEFRADFAGIVMRGGSEGFHILKAGVVWSFLESISGNWPNL